MYTVKYHLPDANIVNAQVQHAVLHLAVGEHGHLLTTHHNVLCVVAVN